MSDLKEPATPKHNCCTSDPKTDMFQADGTIHHSCRAAKGHGRGLRQAEFCDGAMWILRTIRGANGNTYVLPTGEFERGGEDLTGDQVHSDAWRNVASVSQRFSILITEAARITWSGLTQVWVEGQSTAGH